MNRVAMITGSSRGMGKAEAYEFASRGYDVIVHYVNSKEAAENISEDIKKKYGVKTAVIKADLAKESEVRELASKALEVFGRVDVLVNNAGIALYDEFQKKTVQGFEQSMQVNLYAPFLLTQILGAEMVKNKY